MLYRSRNMSSGHVCGPLKFRTRQAETNTKSDQITVRLSEVKNTPGAKPVSSILAGKTGIRIPFRNPIAPDDAAGDLQTLPLDTQNAQTDPERQLQPNPHQSTGGQEIKFPWHVTCFNLGITQAACLMLLGAIAFMPKQSGVDGWWPTAGADAMSFGVPGILHGWEIIAAVLGLLLVPILRSEFRARFTLNLGMSLLGLMVLAVCQQQIFGVELVFLPTLGVLALVWLHAISRARSYCRESASLKIWQLLAAGAVIVFWMVPLLVELTQGYFDNIFSSMGPNYLRPLFILGCSLSIAAGAAALAGQTLGRISDWFNWCSGALALFSAAAIGVVCYTGATKLSNIFDPNAQNIPWMGTGFMWLFLLITGGIVLVWSGLMQRFGFSALYQRAL
ncbi:MAG TPA: hypothetical protein VMG59_11545 [Phycisphaerae bacterium]|nr:hypothetical protein [Phycisphaerae bacterium]